MAAALRVKGVNANVMPYQFRFFSGNAPSNLQLQWPKDPALVLTSGFACSDHFWLHRVQNRQSGVAGPNVKQLSAFPGHLRLWWIISAHPFFEPAWSSLSLMQLHIPTFSHATCDANVKVLAFWHSLPLHIQQGFSTNEDLSQFQTFQGAWWKEKAFSNLNPFWNSTWRQLDWPSSVVWYFAHAHALIKKKGMSMYVAHLDPLTVAYWSVLCPKIYRLRLCGQTASRGYIIVGPPKPCAASFSGLLMDSQVCIGHLLTHPSSVTDLTSAGP